MQQKVFQYLKRPKLYDAGTASFWDDDHISVGLLEQHLDLKSDDATRNHFFVDISSHWITESFPPVDFHRLLDLGCGAGVYAEKFYLAGYQVAGVDISRRSIRYAASHAKKEGYSIQYQHMDYLTLNFREQFDIVTMTGCEYGTLSPGNRNLLLKKIYAALKPGGVIVLDAYSDKNFTDKKESDNFRYFKDGSFWHPKEHIYLTATYLYDNRTSAEQHIVIVKGNVSYFNLWEHDFKEQELKAEIQNPGFTNIHFYGDLAGSDFNFQSKTICVCAQKP
ncbi:class I SAM-dependent methyltransferase [Christensenellaceae bacterium OttesenSCG-928-K19]|nr:class I SAM-dependent methyltransferase [Christensenellaceae bacterium OttesenSCG-928-K19]